MQVWNPEETSEFYINVGIISIKLVCKSLVMDNISPKESIERKGPDQDWGTTIWIIRKWSVKWRRMQRNSQTSWKMLWLSKIMEDKEERFSEDTIWQFWIAENSQEKTQNWQ